MSENTLHIIDDSGGCCDKCYKYAQTLYVSTAAQHCPECYIEEEVPETNFYERLDCAWLWSKENQCVDTASLATLIKCGWFMSEKTIDESQTIPKVIYKLKYYGKKACPRCTGIDFSNDTEECDDAGCRRTVEKGRAISNEFWDAT